MLTDPRLANRAANVLPPAARFAALRAASDSVRQARPLPFAVAVLVELEPADVDMFARKPLVEEGGAGDFTNIDACNWDDFDARDELARDGVMLIQARKPADVNLEAIEMSGFWKGRR